MYKLEVGDQLAVTQEAKHDAVLNFFENVLGTAKGRDYTIDLSEIGVQQHNLSSLDAPFTEDVWVTIKDMPLDKAPGLDGFTGRFYKSCWNNIKGDHVGFISHSSGMIDMYIRQVYI